MIPRGDNRLTMREQLCNNSPIHRDVFANHPKNSEFRVGNKHKKSSDQPSSIFLDLWNISEKFLYWSTYIRDRLNLSPLQSRCVAEV